MLTMNINGIDIVLGMATAALIISAALLYRWYRQRKCRKLAGGGAVTSETYSRQHKNTYIEKFSDEQRAKLRELLRVSPWTCPSTGWLTEGEECSGKYKYNWKRIIRIFAPSLCLLWVCCVLDDYGRIYPTIAVIVYFIIFLSTDGLMGKDARK